MQKQLADLVSASCPAASQTVLYDLEEAVLATELVVPDGDYAPAGTIAEVIGYAANGKCSQEPTKAAAETANAAYHFHALRILTLSGARPHGKG